MQKIASRRQSCHSQHSLLLYGDPVLPSAPLAAGQATLSQTPTSLGLQATLARLRRQAPGLVADAGEGLPEASPTALLEVMLVLLRGNRASACVTYFTRDGQLRAVAPPT